MIPALSKTMTCLLVAVFVSALISCQGNSTSSNCEVPSGTFINTTILDQCPNLMPADIPHFCVEMTFKDSTTVEVDNGFEKFALRLTPSAEGCNYTLNKATLYGDMELKVLNDSTLMLMDTAWTKLDTGTVFKRINVNGDVLKFEEALNDCLVAGEYSLFKNGELSPHMLTILSNGQLNGLKPYLGYELCYAGDCLEETIPPSRIITLIDDKGQRDMFVFKNIEGKMSIELYAISPPIPDVKGERTIGPLVYEFRTE
jgi:hypothetical protein